LLHRFLISWTNFSQMFPFRFVTPRVAK
jgi:hypothetical protein